VYDSLDIHVVHCLSVLVDADQALGDYYMVASTRFIHDVGAASIVIRYAGSSSAPPAPNMTEPPADWAWSINQARLFRWNLTASAARPSPQGSYHYGQINITRTIKVMVSRGHIDGKLRYIFNDISHRDTETPPSSPSTSTSLTGCSATTRWATCPSPSTGHSMSSPKSSSPSCIYLIISATW
jgi:L-ascorbate oxidase